MKKLMIAVVGVLVLAAVTCTPTGAGNYFPLALNNVWNTIVTTVTTWHGSHDTTFTHTDSSKLTVVADTTLGGKAAWKLQTTYGTMTGTSYAIVESDRVLSYSSPTDSAPSVMLKTPLAQNATWIVDSTPSMGRLTATAKGQENVSTPAGTFSKAWHVDEVSDSMPDFVMNLWYASGVGQVKQYYSITQTMGGDTMTVTTTAELKSYTVK
jgi:hypothetical protein